MSSPQRRPQCRGNPTQGRPQSGRGRGRGNVNPKPQRAAPYKFKGNSTELAGSIFDCSDYKQADTYVTTLKHISEYVGAEYKHGGDIRSSIINEVRMVIPIPTHPVYVNPDALTPAERVQEMIFKGEIDAFIKRRSILSDNIQKAYSLILGQCTDLLQSKLKQQANWEAILQAQDALALLALIKTVTFRFEDQKFLPLALYQSKLNLYSLRQGNMSNTEYLQRFQNLVDVAMAYNGHMHDQAIIDIIAE